MERGTEDGGSQPKGEVRRYQMHTIPSSLFYSPETFYIHPCPISSQGAIIGAKQQQPFSLHLYFLLKSPQTPLILESPKLSN